MFVFTNDSARNWKEYTLIVPSVSVGNVGQLTSDLLISTKQMSKIGYLHDDSILPMVGNDPFSLPNSSSCDLVTSCEIFLSSEEKIVLIQQRAPFVKGKRAAFRQKLIDWIKSCDFREVIILTSSFAHERLDRQLSGIQERFVASPRVEERVGRLVQEKGWVLLEQRQAFPAPSAIQTTDNGTASTIYLPGGGIAKSLFEACGEDVPVLLLLTFCSEGDNAPDAVRLANCLNQYLLLSNTQETGPGGGESRVAWKIPSSWRLTFGSRAEPMLFH